MDHRVNVASDLRKLAADLRAVAKASPIYSMVSQPSCNIIGVAEDYLCALARVIELEVRLLEEETKNKVYRARLPKETGNVDLQRRPS